MHRTVAILRRAAFPCLLLLPACLYLAAFLVLIVVRVAALSLTVAAPGAAASFPTLAGYAALWGAPAFRAALARTACFAAIGAPLQLLAGLAPALLVHRTFAGRGLVRSLFILPLAIPGIVIAVILWIVTNYPHGHLNDLLTGRYGFPPALLAAPVNWRASPAAALGLALAGKIWHDMPISMLILLAGLQSIPAAEYEAAATLGAGAWQRFRFITLPHLVPAMATVLVLRSIEMWKEFLFPFVLAPRYPLLGTLIDEAYHEWNDPLTAARVAVALIVCIAASTLLVRAAMARLRRRLVRI